MVGAGESKIVWWKRVVLLVSDALRCLAPSASCVGFQLMFGSAKRTLILRGRVSRDTSLDEYFGGDEERADSTDEDSSPAESTPQDEDGSTVSEIEPATPTYACSPDAQPCERCGETTDRRWQCGGQFVCEDCKEW